MEESLYIAVDLGAGSGRVFLAGVAPDELLLEEINRFYYPPHESDGHLRWNFPLILEEIKKGLRIAGDRARELNRPIYSIGVDSWGVDYGLIDRAGELLENPICYRDNRTAGVMEKIFARISREEIFRKTGIQFMVFNTLFQLYAQNGNKNAAAKLLLMPDLIDFFLTGRAVTEYTNATTTQMLNAKSGNWDKDLIECAGLPPKLLTEIVSAGTDLGSVKPEIAEELNLENVHVIVPATHDTGSAVAGAPLEKDWAYISSGTWSLVGIERQSVLVNEEVSRHNFTNEGGAFGTIRFLKNVMGLWIFESCRREWKERGIDTGYENLLHEVAAISDFQGFIFPDDERFLNPPGMLAAIAGQLAETGQDYEENPAVVTKIILDSLAFRYASVLRTIEKLTGEKLRGVQIVGGGGRNDYLSQMTANASRLEIVTGLTEATVTGNVLVQAIAAGRFSSLEEARNHIRQNVRLKQFHPQISNDFENGERNYGKIESFYLNGEQ